MGGHCNECGSNPCLCAEIAKDNSTFRQVYVPEIWKVRKDVIYASKYAVKNGLEYAKECLATHDATLDRTTHKNKCAAELMEADILQMESTLTMLRECSASFNETSEPIAELVPIDEDDDLAFQLEYDMALDDRHEEA